MKKRQSRKKDTPPDTTSPMEAVETDPNGSYTGVPQNHCEVPVQDVDDL